MANTQHILTTVDGINTAVCVGRGGFVIDSAASAGTDVDAIGAMLSTGLSSAQSLGNELNVGKLT